LKQLSSCSPVAAPSHLSLRCTDIEDSFNILPTLFKIGRPAVCPRVGPKWDAAGVDPVSSEVI